MVSVSGSTGWNPLEPITMIVGNPVASGGVQAPTYSVPYQPYTGVLDIQVLHRDGLDLTKTREEGEEVRTTFYKRISDEEFVTLTSGDHFAINVSRDDKLYFTLEPLRESGLYVSPLKMSDRNLNPRIIDFDYVDITKDGIYEWLFVVDITELPVNPSQVAPKITLFTLTYDEGQMALSSPSDIKVGEGSSINNIKWELEVPQNQAVAINQVELIFDSGDSSLVNDRISWIKIPYFDNLEFPEMDQTVLQGKLIYKFKIGTSLAQAGYVSTEHNADPRHDMTVRLGTNLEKDDELGVTLKVTAITPDQSYYTISDKVILTAKKNAIQQEVIYEEEELDKLVWSVTMNCEIVDGGKDCVTTTVLNNYTK